MHVPFCRQLCPYCDFAVAVRREIPHEAYSDAVIAELHRRSADLDGRDVQTIYFGGGTPALLAPKSLARIAALAIDRAGTPAEVTIEANPLDVTAQAVQRWQSMGFTRLSLGVQSFQSEYLEGLGRDHSGTAAHQAMETALASGLTVSMDLIYGGPLHSEAILRADLAVVRELEPQHVSAYQLTVEAGTVFGRRARAGELALPDEDRTADLSDLVIGGLAALGFERYEVSSYAREGFVSRHNSGYWTGAEYLGVGMGAHSLRIDGTVLRRANTRRLADYLARSSSAFEEEEIIDTDHFRERLFLALRTRLGVSTNALVEQFGEALTAPRGRLEELLLPLRETGLVEWDGDWLRPTPRGLDLSDVLAERVWRADFS